MTRFPRGSEWRKWDLHIHPPGTKLSDGYGGDSSTDRFCRILEESDVAAFGVTDYFSADRVYAVKDRYSALYPQTTKTIFPNVELRLNETVNGNNQIVDIHLIFRPDAPLEQVQKLLGELKTQLTDANGRHLRCSELTTQDHFMRATVTRDDIERAITETYGKRAVCSDYLLIVVPANNNGIRAESGKQRKENLADQIDKLCDGIFGNSGNSRYFLRTDRLEDPEQMSVPKPVFAGSDAHNFADLEAWLGRSVDSAGARKEVTWIKADPTFEGLQQTLVEPEDRVCIQAVQPDFKEPYKVISAVHFSGTDDFPECIPFNQNLVSIIGSRSSGKSALLAYIAHAVDPEYAINQQLATGVVDSAKVGPAAGKTWTDVASIQCRVEWADENVDTGKVIYIPQNILYAVSERPDEITDKIRPALFRLDPDLETAYNRMESELGICNATIRAAVEEWFNLGERIKTSQGELRDLGDPKAISSTRHALAEKIEELQAASSLTAEDLATYQVVADRLDQIRVRQKSINDESVMLSPFIEKAGDGYVAGDSVDVSIKVTPVLAALPSSLQSIISTIVEETNEPLRTRLRNAVTDYQVSLDSELERLNSEDESLRAENAEVINRNQANAELEVALAGRKKQDQILGEIAAKTEAMEVLTTERSTQIVAIQQNLEKRQVIFSEFTGIFHRTSRELDGMIFGVETGMNEEVVRRTSSGFNRQENTSYFERSSDLINLPVVLSDPGRFLQDLESGAQRVRRGESKARLAACIIGLTPDVRFYACLEEDRIGGFERSSMTPGKQALFALTLILNESTDPWPLLIDQPEDDLDSRSIYDTIVKYLNSRKRYRQILMVTHNANLVIGADSEQVVVANRHGEDRKNRNSRTFEYFTGSLEHSLAFNDSEFILEACGVREHACEILDGGEEAFRKRKEKYNI